MSPLDLGAFWEQNKQRIGEALPGGASDLAKVFQSSADAFDLRQTVDEGQIRWQNAEGQPLVTFVFIPDPRDLERILHTYVQAKQERSTLTVVFVHQWTDGEGNWDVFAIGPRRAMQHCDRIRGSNAVKERGPHLREDIYNLFASDCDFSEPGQAGWAELLAGPVDRIANQLSVLAAKHECIQTIKDRTARWFAATGRLEAQFFVLPDPEEIDAYISMYRQIQERPCPVSFVFAKSNEPRLYDIFRLSARSYLEHHNQIKGRLRLEVTGKRKTLEGLRWVPRWASHVGCIKGCLNHLKRDVSDAWLFGGTGHAFVLNISPGLCASGPTDWDTSGFLRLGRNLSYQAESVEAYCPTKANRREAQERAWDHVRRSIDEGLPCYGWELDIPEYYVIFGYDKTGYYISGPGCDEGAGPIPWRNLGTSEIGMVLVASVRDSEPTDARRTVRDAFAYALDIGYNRIKWTDRTGGLEGYTAWIETMESGRAGRFGLGYSAAVWAESRRFAVEFLREAQQRLGDDLHTLFDSAISQYDTVARNLKAVSDAYPFQKCRDHLVKVDDHALGAVKALKQARDAETSGLEILADLAAKLNG
jgi:hypothetical protein